jgi:nitrite reductase (cytochrome c-552)
MAPRTELVTESILEATGVKEMERMRSHRTERGIGAAGVGFIVVVTAAATIGILLLLDNIRDRKDEAKQTVFAIAELGESTVDPAEWGKNYPRQYDSYKRTVDVERTKYGGSEAFQKLDDDPVWRTIFAGYAFAIDYREERGHAYMLADQRETERVKQKKQPGACLHCHASNVVAYREQGLKAGAPGAITDPLTSEAGWTQLQKGFEAVCAMPYSDATALVKHPVACIDCHDPKTQALRLSKPAFVAGLQALARSGEALPHFPSIERWRKGDKKREYDPNATPRARRCARSSAGSATSSTTSRGDGKLVTYPWHKGSTSTRSSRTTTRSASRTGRTRRPGAPVLKAQHPEFEMWSQGIHAARRDRAPTATCRTCAKARSRSATTTCAARCSTSPARARPATTWSEDEMKARVETIQAARPACSIAPRTALVSLIEAIEAAEEGRRDRRAARGRPAVLQRKAQFYLDFVSAENSMGFHAPRRGRAHPRRVDRRGASGRDDGHGDQDGLVRRATGSSTAAFAPGRGHPSDAIRAIA